MLRFFHLLLPVCMAMMPCGSAAAEIIVHRAVPERDLSRNVARLVFTMRLLRWQDQSRIRVFVLPDSHSLHREFTKQTLDLYPRQLRRVWDRNLYSGAGPVPVELSSLEEMERVVAETPGAIGYLPDGLARETVRVIHVR